MDYLRELPDVLPVIFSLLVIEGLLSVDNALAIAALASHLPKQQRAFALRVGIVGAYLFRGIAMFLVALIIANPWLKVLGAAYLIYLMASNLAGHGRDKGDENLAEDPPRSLFMTILQIEIMDLTLSLDNVVAAVAFDRRIWVVCTGVFIGILALRFLAGWCIGLMQRFPVLGPTAFLLIGFVGVILSVEAGTDFADDEGPGVHITALQKFAGIVMILAMCLAYDRTAVGRAVLRPVVAVGAPLMVALDKVFGVIFWPAAKCIRWGLSVVQRRQAVAQDSTPP